jgi:hypothetical protein
LLTNSFKKAKFGNLSTNREINLTKIFGIPSKNDHCRGAGEDKLRKSKKIILIEGTNFGNGYKSTGVGLWDPWYETLIGLVPAPTDIYRGPVAPKPEPLAPPEVCLLYYN